MVDEALRVSGNHGQDVGSPPRFAVHQLPFSSCHRIGLKLKAGIHAVCFKVSRFGLGQLTASLLRPVVRCKVHVCSHERI